MGKVVITLRIMPESPDVDLETIREQADVKIEAWAGEPSGKVETKPVAFGLQALDMTIVADEEKGGTDNLEEEIKTIDGVQSVEVTHIDRTF